jgi:hypothetical protein
MAILDEDGQREPNEKGCGWDESVFKMCKTQKTECLRTKRGFENRIKTKRPWIRITSLIMDDLGLRECQISD